MDEINQVPESNGEVHLAPYVLGLFDLLGQKEYLSNWPGVFELHGQLTASQDDAVNKTAGVCTEFRDKFIESFNHIMELQEATRFSSFVQLTEQFPEQQLEISSLLDRLLKGGVETESFSDTVLCYFNLLNKDNDVLTKHLHALLRAACGIALEFLGSKIPIRGGISLGTGTKLKDGSFYGPPLASAYHLENCNADWPRILIDNCILDDLITHHQFSEHTLIDKAAKRYAENAKKLIAKDPVDELLILDYLGEEVRRLSIGEHDPNGENAKNNVEQAYRFVCDEVRHFWSKRNEKLLMRYLKLKDYFDSRLDIWGIEKIDLKLQ